MSAKKVQQAPEEGTTVKDESRDHIYYTITPRLVWALSEDPFDLALWIVVKDIAGEKGVCILAREDLAILSMMSAGQCSKSRDRLLERKLLNGELKRDPGYPQEVWHLSIPDFWEANVRWARMYPTIRNRVEFKRAQRELRRALKDPSPCDASRETSQGDEGIPPSDEGIPPSDVKKNVLKKPKEEIKEEELKNLFLKASEMVFPETKDLTVLRTVTSELDLSRYSLDLEDRRFTVSGLPGERPEFYQDRYKAYFERAFVGLLGEAVSIDFIGGDVPPN